ncbi:MAG: prealbumin-like fold domain-containing protein [Lachnospiraceae bacterium]|nr:prealbumin-like fold domain-containing protein [Lachnospiraceae bacterium]
MYLHDEWTEYSGKLYLMDGDYRISETENTISSYSVTGEEVVTVFDSISAEGITIQDEGKVYSFSVEDNDTAVLTAENDDQLGGIQFTKEAVGYSSDGDGEALAGVVFGLYRTEADAKSGENPVNSDTVAALENGEVSGDGGSDAAGLVTFSSLTEGTWYIKELYVPDGILIDDNVYEVTVEAGQLADNQSGENVSYTGTVTNKRNSEDIYFEKLLLTITKDGDSVIKDETAVPLECLDDFAGVFSLECSIDGGETWQAVEEDGSGTISDSSFGLKRLNLADESGSSSAVSYASLTGLPVYYEYYGEGNTGNILYLYRIVEILPETSDGTEYEAYGGTYGYTEVSDGVIATEPFTLEDGMVKTGLSNKSTGQATVEKVFYYASDGLEAAVVEDLDGYENIDVYICQCVDGKLVMLDGGTMELMDSGLSLTVDGLDLIDANGEIIQYYWAENTTVVSKDGVTVSCVLQGTDGETQTVYDENGEEIGEFYVSAAASYASVSDTENMVVTLNNLLPFRRVAVYKHAVYGDTASNEWVSGAAYTVIQSEEDGTFAVDQMDLTDEELQAYLSANAYDSKEDGLSNGTSYNQVTIGSGGAVVLLQVGYKYRFYETAVPDNASGLKDSTGADIPYVEIDLTDATVLSQDELEASAGTVTFYDEPYRKVQLYKYLYDVNGSASGDGDAVFDIYYSETADGTFQLYCHGSEINMKIPCKQRECLAANRNCQA